MSRDVMIGFGVLILTAGMSNSFAQTPPAPPLPPTAPGASEIRIIERDVEFLGSRRGALDVGIDTWELTPGMLGRLADELALTPAQQGQITEIMATHRPKMRQIREQLRQESRQLREIGPETRDFDARSQASAERVGTLSAELVTQGSVLRKQVWNVLTPEQRLQLEQRQSQLRERRYERFERRQSPRGDGPKWRERQSDESHSEKRRIIIREHRPERRDD